MMILNLESMGHFRIRYTMLLSLLGISNIGLFQGGVDEVWDRETKCSQLAKRSLCVVVSR